jgi:hypothetical protein
MRSLIHVDKSRITYQRSVNVIVISSYVLDEIFVGKVFTPEPTALTDKINTLIENNRRFFRIFRRHIILSGFME